MLVEADKRDIISLILAIKFNATNIKFEEKLDHEKFEVVRTVSFNVDKVHKKALLQNIVSQSLEDGIVCPYDACIPFTYNGVFQFYEDGIRIMSKDGISSIFNGDELNPKNGNAYINNRTKRFFMEMKYEQS